MQYEFRGKSLAEAVSKAVHSHRSLQHKDIPSCDELRRLIEQAQSDLETSLNEVERAADDIEYRLSELESQARNATVSLAIDVVLAASSAISFVGAIRAVYSAAKIGQGVAKGIFGASTAAAALKRDIDTTFNRLEQIAEYIDLNAIKIKLDQDLYNVELYAARLEYLSQQFEEAGCEI